MSEKTYYETLECSPDSTSEEIRRAYHKLALKHHPDKNANSKSFLEIEKAWRVLSNEQSRKDYDILLKQHNLEDMTCVLYATISPDELKETSDPNILSYPCRCGNEYKVEKNLLEPNTIFQIPCVECTFSIEIKT